MPVEINLFSPEINTVIAPAWPTANEQGYADYANSAYSASQAQAENARRMNEVASRIPEVATGAMADATYANYAARSDDMHSQSLSLDARASASAMNAQSIFNTKNMLNTLGADAQAQIEAATAAQMASAATGSVSGTVSLEAAKQGILANLSAAVQMVGAGFSAANEQLNKNIAMSQSVSTPPQFMVPSLPPVGNASGWGAMSGLPPAYSGQDFLGGYAGGYGSPLMNAGSMPGMASAYPQGYNMAAMPTYDGTPGSLINVLLANAPAVAQLAQVALGVGSQVFNQFQQAASVFTAGVAGAAGAAPGASGSAAPATSSPFSTPSSPLSVSGGGGTSSPSASLDASATVNGETRGISATADSSGVRVDTSPNSSDSGSSDSGSSDSGSSDSGSSDSGSSAPEDAPASDDGDSAEAEPAPEPEAEPASEPEAEPAPEPAPAPAEESNPSSQLQTGGTTPNVDTVAASNPNTTLSGRFTADADADGVRATGTTTLTSAAPPEVPSNVAAAQQAAAQAPTTSPAASTAPASSTSAPTAPAAAPMAAAPMAAAPAPAPAAAPTAGAPAGAAPATPPAAGSPANPGSSSSTQTSAEQQGRHAAPSASSTPQVSRIAVEPVVVPAADDMVHGLGRHLRKGVRVAAAIDREYARAGVDNTPLAVAVIDNATTIYATAEDFGFPAAGMDGAPRGTKPLSAYSLPEDFRARWVGADDPAAVLLIAANQGFIPVPKAVVAVDRDKQHPALDGVDTISRQTLSRITPETSIPGALASALPTLDVEDLPEMLENISIDWSLPELDDTSSDLYQAVVARSWKDTTHPQVVLATIWWLLVSAREALDSGDRSRASACIREVLTYPLPDTSTSVA